MELIKLWNDGSAEATTWEKELPVIQCNYRTEAIEGIKELLEMGKTVRISPFSSITKSRPIEWDKNGFIKKKEIKNEG